MSGSSIPDTLLEPLEQSRINLAVNGSSSLSYYNFFSFLFGDSMNHIIVYVKSKQWLPSQSLWPLQLVMLKEMPPILFYFYFIETYWKRYRKSSSIQGIRCGSFREVIG